MRNIKNNQLINIPFEDSFHYLKFLHAKKSLHNQETYMFGIIYLLFLRTSLTSNSLKFEGHSLILFLEINLLVYFLRH